MGMVARTKPAFVPNAFCCFRIPIPTSCPVVSSSPPALRNKSPFCPLPPPLLAKPKKYGLDHHTPAIIEEVSLDDDDGDDDVVVLDDVMEDVYDREEYLDEEKGASEVGDGGEGGGISLAGTSWDKEVLAIIEEVLPGSPSMEDIEAFSTVYRSRLDEAEAAQLVPDNLSLEVSSPGVERIVWVPHDLDRFEDRPMYVKYVREQEAEVLHLCRETMASSG